MKPLGLFGNKGKSWDYGYEDMLSIVIGARKSSIGKILKKCKEFKNSLRSSIQKRKLRRYHKRSEKQNFKIEL